MDQPMSGKERRQHIRIKRHYIIRFYLKDNPAIKYEVSQVEDISKGGMRFSSTFSFEENVALVVELRTPYLSETVVLEGVVLETTEKIKGILFQNRLKFENVSAAARDILDKVEQYNSKRT